MIVISIGLAIAIIIILINLGSRLLNLENLNKEILDGQKRYIKRLDILEGLLKRERLDKETVNTTITAPDVTAPILSANTPPPLPNPVISVATKDAEAPLIQPNEYKRPIQIEVSPNVPVTTSKTNSQTTPTNTPTTSRPNPNPEDTGLPFINWLKEDWLMKIGSIMLLLALGWFVTYAFMQNWIGPAGRIFVGAVAALSLLVLGTKRMKIYPNQGGVFLSIGGAIMVVTMIASSNYYSVLPALIALAISATTLGYIAKKALDYQSRALIYLSITLATISPFLFGYLGNTEFILGYLLILTLAIAYINWNWELQELPLVSSSIAFLYSAPYIMLEFNNWEGPSTISLTLAFLTLGIIIAQNLYSLNKSDETKTLLLSTSSILSTVTLIGWSMRIGTQDTPGYIIGAWSILLAIISRLIFLKTDNKKAFFTTWALSTVLMILAIHIILELPEITIAFLTVCLINIIIAHRVSPLSKLPTYVAYGLMIPCFSALKSLISTSWQETPINIDSLVLLLTSASLIAVGLWFKKLNHGYHIQERQLTYRLLVIVGSIYGLCLIWLTLTNSLDQNLGIAVTLSIYTIIGLICYFQGIKRGSLLIRKYGVVLLSLIIFRLFIVDLWNMDIAGRIITFFAIGILLVSTAFLGKRQKEKSKH
jgi:uncharacterized membrane protein